MQHRRIKRFHYLFVRIAVLWLLFSCWYTSGAQDSSKVHTARDSGWVETFNNAIVVKLAAINTAEVLVAEGDNFKNVLQPNPTEVFRGYFNYRVISFYVNYIPHFLPGNNDDAEKGTTKGIGLGTVLNFRDWFTEVYYSHTKGYYLENTKDYRPAWQPGDPYFQVPDLTVNRFEGATGYNTNPRFSLRAIASQTERQLKSAGAFIPQLSYSYYTIDNRTPGPYSTQSSSHIQGLLGAGYHHTFVVKKSLYATGSFTPSFGYIFSRLTTRNSTEQVITSSQGPVYQWDGRLGIGYNGHRFFTGLYLTAKSATYAQGLTTAVTQNGNIFFQLFAGVRLVAPKFIRKTYDTILH
jgi:hypothetical protein